MPNLIYLDHNATTPVHPTVLTEMLPYFSEQFGNPSSNHPLGWEASAAIAKARAQVAELIGCSPEEVIFTSGGTEANNIALRGLINRSQNANGALVTSAVEHPAIVNPCNRLAATGTPIVRLPVDTEGIVDLEACSRAITSNTALVSIMHANNETGTIQPIREISKIARAKGALVHTDAAQSAGKVPCRVDELDVDLLSIAGHKLYAPKGIGALYVRKGVNLAPCLLGASHERGLRPGTENVPAIVALGAACALAARDLDDHRTQMAHLTRELLKRLQAAIPNIRLNGHPTLRLPNTLNISFPDISGSKLLARTDAIAASTGAACHEGGDETPSEVLTAMGVPTDTALGSVRLSLGRATTEAAIATAAEALIKTHRDLASR